jgi:hypothetical protein
LDKDSIHVEALRLCGELARGRGSDKAVVAAAQRLLSAITANALAKVALERDQARDRKRAERRRKRAGHGADGVTGHTGSGVTVTAMSRGPDRDGHASASVTPGRFPSVLDSNSAQIPDLSSSLQDLDRSEIREEEESRTRDTSRGPDRDSSRTAERDLTGHLEAGYRRRFEAALEYAAPRELLPKYALPKVARWVLDSAPLRALEPLALTEQLLDGFFGSRAAADRDYSLGWLAANPGEFLPRSSSVGRAALLERRRDAGEMLRQAERRRESGETHEERVRGAEQVERLLRELRRIDAELADELPAARASA